MIDWRSGILQITIQLRLAILATCDAAAGAQQQQCDRQ
jgi:hypothetical protein